MLEIKIEWKWWLINKIIKTYMLDIIKLKNTWCFKEIFLEKWEILFSEWNYDDNIYIVEVWELIVSKYTNKKTKETKILAYISKNEVFWEASLNGYIMKEVNIVAKRKTVLLSINWKEWIEELLKKDQIDTMNLLKYIIYLSNKRLSEANYLITANYKISKYIIELKEINYKSIFQLIENIKELVWVDHIIYYEVNPVMENYLILKYDTRNKWKLLNDVIELNDNKLELLNLTINDFYIHTQKLSIWINDLWYLVFLRKIKRFNDSDKKVFAIATAGIAWLIKQKLLIDEERDKRFMED